MPQKQNPDALELVRGKAARAQAGVIRLLALMKSLPAGYQKDLQEDKEAVFDVADTVSVSVRVMGGVVSGLEFDRARMRAAAGKEELMAAGLAVALARDGLPFRKAHGVVAGLVAEARKTEDVAARDGAPGAGQGPSSSGRGRGRSLRSRARGAYPLAPRGHRPRRRSRELASGRRAGRITGWGIRPDVNLAGAARMQRDRLPHAVPVDERRRVERRYAIAVSP